MKYPEECPVFEVTGAAVPWQTVPAGVHFEGFLSDYAIGLVCGVPDDFMSHRNSDRWWAFKPGWVRPLTRAAREMLALVRS